MMEAARASETLVNLHQTTRRYIPEISHLGTEFFFIISTSFALQSVKASMMKMLGWNIVKACRLGLNIAARSSVLLLLKGSCK
jgi:hypothetical protein